MSSKSVQQGHLRRRSKLIVSFFMSTNLLSFIDLAGYFGNDEFDTFPPSSTILQENNQISC